MTLIKKLLITRPYSWIGIVLIAILANVMATNTFIIGVDLFFDIFTALIVWYTGIFLGEFLHRKIDKRGLTTPHIPIIFIIILSCILFYKNILTLVFLLIIIIVDFIYSMKVTNWFLSRFSFMFRGILEVCVFLIILFFHGNYNILKFLPTLLVIYFLTNSRNLVGDIRDIRFDCHTFPNKYGINMSYAVSIILILTSILLLPNFMVMLPLILLVPIILFSKNAYILHKIFVICTTFFYMNYILSFLEQDLIFTNILFVAVLLNFTYDLVPRKSNPKIIYSYQK
jgi:hypothetical protein